MSQRSWVETPRRGVSTYFAYDQLTPKIEAKIKTRGASFSQYAGRPVEFALEVLKVKHLTKDQKLILESVRDNKETNVQACHGAGKSMLAGAILVPYWIFAMQGLCITTAPTERQVKQILWSEVRRSHARNKAKLGGSGGEMFLKVSEDARAFGFTSRSTDSNGFQGIHADRLLLIEDEACGISPDIDEGAESCLVGVNNRMLRIGNPLADGTPFSKACKKSHIRIPAWRHPNVAWAYRQDSDGIHRVKEELRPYLFSSDGKVLGRGEWGKPAIAAMQAHLKAEKAIEIKGAVSVEWIEGARDKYHEGSAFWESRVEARFPLDSGNSVIPRRYFMMARIRFDQQEEEREALRDADPRYGVDVGDGGDPHAIARWRGDCLWFVKSYPTLGDELDTLRAADYVTKQVDKFGEGYIGVDNVGVGAGTLAILKDRGLLASGIRWGEGAQDRTRFLNLKAEQYWKLREQMEAGQTMIAPLGDYEEQVMEDWANTFYETTPTELIKMEDKKKTITRLGRSPNCGDAAVYGYHAESPINPLLLG